MRRLREKLLDYSYIVTLVVSILVYLLFSFLVVEDGALKLNDFSGYNWLDWLFFIGGIALPTFIGLMINTSFRRMGYKSYRDDEEIKKLYEEYHSLKKMNTKDKKYVTTETYMRRQNAKDAVVKSAIGAGSMFLAMSMMVAANFNQVVSTIVVLLMWIVMGFLSMIKLYDYGMNEGKEALERDIYEMRTVKDFEDSVLAEIEDKMKGIIEVQKNGNS